MLERIALGFIVVDPELGLVLGHQIGDALERGEGLLGAGVHRGHAAIIPIVAEVNGVAAEDEGP